MFTGYSGETLDFLWGIRFNNDRSWFAAHKEAYLRCLYQPTLELGAQTQALFSEKFPKLSLNLHVSRIYRDARRLHGRGPYKDHLWFCVEQPSEQWTAHPTLWFELGPESWSYGLGYYMARPVTMARLRARMDRDPKIMTDLTRRLKRQSEFVLEGEEYRRPKAQAPVPELEPWYRKKSFTLCHEAKLEEALFSRDLVDRLKKGYDFLLPYYDYFITLDSDPDPREV